MLGGVVVALLAAGCDWPLTSPTPQDITIINENTNTHTTDPSTGTENQAPRFSQTHYGFTLEAGRAGPIVVGTVQATDPDRDAVTYALDGAGAFVLREAQSGALTYVGPGVETAVPYRLTVTATDPQGATAQAAVTVTVGGGNDGTNGSASAPNLLHVVQHVATAHATDFAASCLANGGTWTFLDRLVEAFRAEDDRFGYNCTRGNCADVSEDAVSYYLGPAPPRSSTDVQIIDVIRNHCSATPQASWLDVTGDGRWRYPR